MAISPLMIWDAYGTPQAHRLTAGTTLESTQLGAATGFTAAVLDATAGRLPHGRMVTFESNLYLNHRGTLYNFVFGSKTWPSTGFTITSPPLSDDQAMSALHVMIVAGVPRIVGFYNLNLSSNSRAFWTEDGSTWSQSSNINNSGSWPGFSMIYDEKLWICGRVTTANVYYWDPAVPNAVTLFNLSNVANGGMNGQLINFQGRLLWIGTTRSGGARQLVQFKELVTGTFLDVPYSGGADPGDMITRNASPGGALGLYEDDGKLYAVFWEMRDNATLGNMQIHEFVPNASSAGSSFQENDISADTIPEDWRAGGAFENTGSFTTQVQVHVDTSNPLAPQVFWWRYNSFSSSSNTFWTWNGNASLATTAPGQGRDFVTAVNPNVTGERLYTEGNFDVTMSDDVTRASKVDFDAQVWSPLDGSSPSSKQGRLLRSIGGSDWVEATISTAAADAPTLISGAGPAPTVSGNLFQGIPVNDSKFEATWDAGADGFNTAGLDFDLTVDVF